MDNILRYQKELSLIQFLQDNNVYVVDYKGMKTNFQLEGGALDVWNLQQALLAKDWEVDPNKHPLTFWNFKTASSRVEVDGNMKITWGPYLDGNTFTQLFRIPEEQTQPEEKKKESILKKAKCRHCRKDEDQQVEHVFDLCEPGLRFHTSDNVRYYFNPLCPKSGFMLNIGIKKDDIPAHCTIEKREKEEEIPKVKVKLTEPESESEEEESIEDETESTFSVDVTDPPAAPRKKRPRKAKRKLEFQETQAGKKRWDAETKKARKSFLGE